MQKGRLLLGFAANALSEMGNVQLPKLHTSVRFPSPAPAFSQISDDGFAAGFADYVRALARLSCAMIALVAAEARRIALSQDCSGRQPAGRLDLPQSATLSRFLARARSCGLLRCAMSSRRVPLAPVTLAAAALGVYAPA
jgi:hypothetical protein